MVSEVQEDLDSEKVSCIRKHYPWIIVLGASLVMFTTGPFISIIMILYKRKFEEVQATNSYEIITFTLYLVTWNAASLFAGPLIEMKSHRWIVLTGIFLAVVGGLFSEFAKTPIDVVISVGMIIGTGCGLVVNPVILIVNEYFSEEKNLGLAMGLIFMILALGGILAPQIVKFMNYSIIYYTAYIASSVFGGLLLTRNYLSDPQSSKR